MELWLNHLVDGPGEYVVVDMTAGADAFASGLFTRFDLTVLVSEPTRRGVGVYRQYAAHAAGHGVALRVLGNKVADADDLAYLQDEVGDALLGCLTPSPWVRAAERGAVAPVTRLEPANLAVLGSVLAALDARERDWAAYHHGDRRLPPAQRRRVGRPRHRRRPRRAGRPRVRAGPSRPVLTRPSSPSRRKNRVPRRPHRPFSTPPRAASWTTRSSSPSSATRCPMPGR